MQIEIICKPCYKCNLMQERMEIILQCLRTKFQAKFPYSINMNTNWKDAEKYGYSLVQLPLVLIDGDIEFVGHVKEEHLLRAKLESRLKGL